MSKFSSPFMAKSPLYRRNVSKKEERLSDKKEKLKQKEYKAEDKSLSWAIFTKILSRLDHAYETDKWLPNPTPLCKWCSVKTCEFQRT